MKEKDMYKFLLITNDILTNNKFLKLKDEPHHGNNRYDHSVRVAIKMYKSIPDKDPNKVKAVRASLLHDFFYLNEMSNLTKMERYKYHPSYSIKNSINYFNIGKFERDMIKTHMFPINKSLPKNKYSTKLVFCDKIIAIKEVFKYRLLHIDDNMEYIDLTKDKYKEKEILEMSHKYNTLVPILEYNNDII